MEEPTGDTSTEISTETSTEQPYDIQAASQRIAAQMGEAFMSKAETPDPERQESKPVPPQTEEKPVTQPAVTTAAPVTYEVPKSWRKEMHEHWSKVPTEAQAYVIEREKQLLDGFSSIRPIQDTLKQHQDYLNSRNVPAHQMIDRLLHAERVLTTGTMEDRQRWYQKLGEDLKLHVTQPATQQDGTQPNGLPPEVQTIKQELDAIKSTIEEERKAKISEIRAQNQKTVDEFAADTKAHPYFEEVADDMTILIKAGHSLQEAYDRAVRMNPVTFEKEKARLLTEHEAKLKENARLSALPKKQAASVNLKSTRDGVQPTEPLGSMEDTIRKAHKKILARAS